MWLDPEIAVYVKWNNPTRRLSSDKFWFQDFYFSFRERVRSEGEERGREEGRKGTGPVESTEGGDEMENGDCVTCKYEEWKGI